MMAPLLLAVGQTMSVAESRSERMACRALRLLRAVTASAMSPLSAVERTAASTLISEAGY